MLVDRDETLKEKKKEGVFTNQGHFKKKKKKKKQEKDVWSKTGWWTCGNIHIVHGVKFQINLPAFYIRYIKYTIMMTWIYKRKRNTHISLHTQVLLF